MPEQLFWLIRLRWLAAAGLTLTIYLVTSLFHLPLPTHYLYPLVLVLGVYNAVSYFLVKKENYRDERLAFFQISVDLIILFLLLHFSGGVENPFIFYFIFHVIIAGILLSPAAAFFQAGLIALLFLALALGEYSGLLRHYPLTGFAPVGLYDNLFYLNGLAFVFISTIFIAAYMASAIASRLKLANLQLEEKDRIKSEYVLRVTHDIKEHLAAIEGCIDPVVEGYCGPVVEQQKDLLIRASSRTKKLLSFVQALLKITQLKLAKSLTMDDFSLAELLKALATDLSVRAAEKGIKFVFKLDPTVGSVSGVPIQLEAALSNILANAIKYTPAGGKIIFEAEVKNDGYLIMVKDSGIGIPKDEQPKLFEEFFRAANAKQVEKMGTGLGLALSKKVIELHQGRIWFESAVGLGTTFYVIIPKKKGVLLR